MEFRILYQDEWLVAIDKPAGFQVHQPEDKRHRVSKAFDCLYVLRRQIERYLYPVHRLDRATSGVLVFALDSDIARKISETFQSHHIKKSYYCVVRGWMDESGLIDRPLSSEIPGAEPKESRTAYRMISQVELPHPVGKYSTARYSLVNALPQTGRMHQIRRHFAQLSHPLVGDTLYGDGQHNRFFRDRFELRSLLLKAHSLEFQHPVSGELLHIRSRWNTGWHKIFDLFGVCPSG